MPPAVAGGGSMAMGPHSPAGGGGAGPVAIPPPTLAEIRALTDVGAMTRLLNETIAREREIDAELELRLTQRADVEKKLAGVQKAAEVLELLRSDAEQMGASVQATCALAESVSGKVRELDSAQSRVAATIARIDATLDRASCIDGAKTALESGDLEAAAKCIATFLQLDQEFRALPNSANGALEGAGGAAESTARQVETALEQRRQLLESKAKLEEVIRKRFAEAAEERNQANVERFARLFTPLGLQEEGLRTYVAYLRRVISVRAREELESIQEALDPGSGVKGPTDFVEALTNLFRDVALAVESNAELLQALMGEDGVVYAVKELQEEVELRGGAIMKRYMEYRRLARLAKEIASTRNAIVGGAMAGAEGPSMREVEVLLEEMLMLSRRSEDYAAFMLERLREVSRAQTSPRAAEIFGSGQFRRAVQELTSFYVLLEEHFMVENVRTAIRIDELVTDSLTTSMVDDVFYILQNCARRAVATGNVQAVGAALNHVNALLGGEYREALQRKLREPNLAARLFSVAGGAVAKTGAEVASAINNADVSAEYVGKLRAEIEEHCAEVFPGPTEREKIKSSLADLSEAGGALKQLAAMGLEELSKSITPRLRTILDSVGGVSYELTEAQYAENEVSDPWVQKLLAQVEASAAWLQPLLTASNYDSLVHLLIDFVVKRLEVVVAQKRFNQLGGLQLDRDARALVGFFSAMTSRTVRDKFARLTQMATILNLEKVNEILDYWGENSGPMAWRLTPAEVRRILGQRVDFRPEAIAALRL